MIRFVLTATFMAIPLLAQMQALEVQSVTNGVWASRYQRED